MHRDAGALGMLVLVVAVGVGSLHEIKRFVRRRLRVETGSQPVGKKGKRCF